MWSVPAKLAAPVLVSRLPIPTFSVPPLPTVSELTVLAKPETSSVPPLTVTAEVAERVPAAPATSVPPLTSVAPP